MNTKTFILGDNPFFGVNHHSRKEGERKAQRFEDPKAVVEVLKIARQHGAAGVMLSSHERVGAIIQEMTKTPELAGFDVYPNIPYLMKYVQRVTQEGMMGTLTGIISQGKGLSNLTSLISGGAGFMQKDFSKMLETAIALEMSLYKGVRTPVIFLHNGLVDLILGLGMNDVLRLYADIVRRKFKAEPGFGTLNLELCARTLLASGFERPIIMAPFNKTGFHMNPSRESSEDVVRNLPIRFYPMNILVSGALRADEAFEYLHQFPQIERAIIGASSENSIASSATLLHPRDRAGMLVR
jgi:hypothetical protein